MPLSQLLNNPVKCSQLYLNSSYCLGGQGASSLNLDFSEEENGRKPHRMGPSPRTKRYIIHVAMYRIERQNQTIHVDNKIYLKNVHPGQLRYLWCH